MPAEPIEIESDGGHLLVREVARLVLFAARPFDEVVGAVRELYDEWCDRPWFEALRWGLLSASSSRPRPMDPRALRRAAEGLDVARVARKSLVAFKVFGPERINPEYGFVAMGSVKDWRAGSLSFVQLRFPPPSTPEEVRMLYDWTTRAARLFPYDAGACGLALERGTKSEEFAFARAVQGLVSRHPGLDVGDDFAASILLGARIRGASWLTLLGDDFVERVGGASALNTLPASVTSARIGSGWLLRAGDAPRRGDVNRHDILEPVRAVASLVAPLVGDPDQTGIANLFYDHESAERWLVRHLESRP